MATAQIAIGELERCAGMAFVPLDELMKKYCCRGVLFSATGLPCFLFIGKNELTRARSGFLETEIVNLYIIFYLYHIVCGYEV